MWLPTDLPVRGFAARLCRRLFVSYLRGILWLARCEKQGLLSSILGRRQKKKPKLFKGPLLPVKPAKPSGGSLKGTKV